jgi:hypothetical protein
MSFLVDLFLEAEVTSEELERIIHSGMTLTFSVKSIVGVSHIREYSILLGVLKSHYI